MKTTLLKLSSFRFVTVFLPFLMMMVTFVLSNNAFAEKNCPDKEFGCVKVEAGEPIRLGTLLAIEGDVAFLGVDTFHGVELAVDSRDGALDGVDGQVLGHAIQLESRNDGCNAADGKAGAEALVAVVNPQVAAVIGTSCSSASVGATGDIGAAGIFSTGGILQVSPSATAPSLTSGIYPFFARTVYNDNLQGKAMASFAWNVLGVTTAATVHDGSPFPSQLQQVFADEFTALGGTITTQVLVSEGATLTPEQLTSLAGGNPQLVFVPLFPPQVTNIIIQLKAAMPPGTFLASADSALDPAFLIPATQGVYVSGPDLSFSGDFYINTFLPAYIARWGEPLTSFHAFAYDGANMVLDAIEDVAIENKDGSMLIPREKLRNKLFKTKNYAGISGTLTCDKVTGDCNPDAVIAIQKQVDNEFKECVVEVPCP